MENLKEVDASKYKEVAKDVKELVILDEKAQIKINNDINTSFSVINDSMKEFITGYMLSEGMIKSITDIIALKIDGCKIEAEIKLNEDYNNQSKIKPITSNLTVTNAEILKKMEELREKALRWEATGGAHVAGIVCGDEFIVKDDDWYTIELSIPDLYSAGLEELNKWPLEPSLELMEYVYAEVNYYNGTEFDDTSRLNTVSIPVITNSILKIGTDNNNQFYDKLESDMLNGRIFSFAQQGDKLCFDVLLPGCVSIDSVKFSYESTINNNADDYFYLNTVKIYRKKDVTNVPMAKFGDIMVKRIADHK